MISGACSIAYCSRYFKAKLSKSRAAYLKCFSQFCAMDSEAFSTVLQ